MSRVAMGWVGCLALFVTLFLGACGGVAEPKQCFVGGCSGQLCGDTEGRASTCEYRAEYACYKTAHCEVQGTGDCGWTPSTELSTCLANAKCQGKAMCKIACPGGFVKDVDGCDTCQCEPITSCGGIANFACPDDKVCVDNPNDTCDVTKGGADCGGICVPKPNTNQ